MGKSMRRITHKKPVKHEIPAWLGAPLWAVGGFLAKRWKPLLYGSVVLLAGYTPYMLHQHATYLLDQQCDELGYLQVLQARYGCDGYVCSDDKAVYATTMQVGLGVVEARCSHTPPPRPDEVFVRLIRYGGEAVSDMRKAGDGIAPEPEAAQVVVAETS